MKTQTSRQFLNRLASRRFSRLLAASGAGMLSALALLSMTPAALAADVSKANTGTNLSLGAAYVGGNLPTAADRISFDSNVTTAANVTALTFDTGLTVPTAPSNLSILGIVVTAPAGPVTINNQPQNPFGSTFNIGSAGIDLSAATQNLTINAGISLSASQSWNVQTGRTLTIGTNANAQAGLSLGANVLTVTGAGATTINDLIYGSGSISMTGAGTLTLNSGLGSGNGPNAGSFFSGGINQSAGTILISGVNSAGTGAINITGGTTTISQSQFLLTNGATVNGGILNVNANVGIAGGTVTLTSGTLSSTAANAFQLVTVAANGGTFTPNAAATSIGALSGSVGFTMAAGTLNFGANNGSGTYSGNIGGAVASNVTKTGSGTQILNGTEATTGTITANGSGGTLEIGGQFNASGNVVVNAGTLRLNFGTNNTVATNLIGAGALTVGGGTLDVRGQTGATNVIQNFSGATFNTGTASTISLTNGAGGGTTALNLAGLTRNAGSAVNFILPSGTQSTTNGIQATSGTAGLLVPTNNTAYATVGGTDFAAKDATNAFIVPLAGTVNATGGASLTASATDNANISTASVSTSGASTINTVRFNNAAGSTVTLGGALTITDGGILVSSAVTSPGSRITGSTITSAAEVVIHQFSAQPFTLDSQVTGATLVDKAGPGTLIVTKANTNNSGNFAAYIGSGTLQIGPGGSFASGVVNISPNDPTAVFDVNNQTTTVSYLAGGNTTGGYTTLGNTGTLNLATASGQSSTYSGALVGGLGSVVNKTASSASNGAFTQGIQGQNQAFFGTLNVNAGSVGLFGGSFINSTVNVNAPAAGSSLPAGSLATGGSTVTALLGNLGGTGGTVFGSNGASVAATYNIGYLGGVTSSYAGVIANGTNAAPGVTNLGKFGSGTTTLSGNNTYTGITQINTGGLIFDYSTGSTTAQSTGSTLSIGGGVATFRGAATGAATAITTGTYTNNNGQLERLTLDNNTNTNGVSVTLKTAVLNSINTLGSSSASNSVLFDTSSSAANVLKTDLPIGAGDTNGTVAIRSLNGLLETGNTSVTTGYRANVLIRDTTGVGFATTGAGNTIIKLPTASQTSLNGNTGGTLAEDSTGNYLLTANLTRTNAAFVYNSLQIDSSAGPVTLVANNIDTFTRFGAGGAATGGRGVLATGTNGVTITDGGGTNQPTYFYNYQTGTAATGGQTLTLNMPLFGTTYTNGTGLTVATDKVDTGDLYVQSGVFRETLAQSSGDALTPGAGVVRLYGGVLEIGAHLTGTTSATSTADFSRSVGPQPGQVQLMGDTGFSAFGANRTVNLGGVSSLLVWGQDSFLVSTAGNNTEGNNTFRLSSAYSDSAIDFQNPIALGSTTRQVDVANGSAAIDARLSGVLSGVAPLTLVTANGAPNITFAAAGLTKLGAGTLELTAANTYRGRTTVAAGTLLANNATSSTGSGEVVVNAAATLGGIGSVAGVVTVSSGATLLGGNGTSAGGALTLVSNPTLSTGSLLSVVLGATGAHSSINLPGSFNGFDPNQAFTLVNTQAGFYDNIITGVAAGINTTGFMPSSGGGFTYTFTDDGANIDLSITAVPEPSTWIGSGLMIVAIAWSQRKRFGVRQAV